MDDPLTYMIETLTRDRSRLAKQRAVLRALGVHQQQSPSDKGDEQTRQRAAASTLQRQARRMINVKRLSSGHQQHVHYSSGRPSGASSAPRVKGRPGTESVLV